MSRRVKALAVVGYCLAIFYGISFLFYLTLFQNLAFLNHAITLSVLFAALFVGAIAVAWRREWGRKVLVAGNAIIFLYSLVLFRNFPNFVFVPYFLMYIAVYLFFKQKRLKQQTMSPWELHLKSILVVDDDEGILKLVKRILLPKGYSVLTANTGEKGLQVARLQRPDLIILDVILPGIKGRDLCFALKEDPKTRDIPVIFLTAKNSPDDIRAEMEAGAVSHITKPVDTRRLFEEIKRIIG